MYSRYKDKLKRKEYLKNWRKKNREKHNEYLRNWYQENEVSYYKKRKGESISSIHKWVEKKLGKPTRCSFCLTIDEKKRYCWANIDHSYKKNLADWIRLCSSCHCEYDRKFNGKKTHLEK